MVDYGALRVWWIPQIPGKPFYVYVENVEQAAMMLSVLAAYDMFQWRHKVKPDYCNAGGMEVYEENGVSISEDGRYWRDGWVEYDFPD